MFAPIDQHPRDKFLVRYSSVAVFLGLFLSLVIPSGYSVGGVLLLLAALPTLFSRATWRGLRSEHCWFIFSFLFFSGLWMVDAYLHTTGTDAYGRPSKIFAGCIVLLYLLRYPPRQEFIWAGVAAGAVATGFWSIYEKFILGAPRADGFTNAIQYGDISVLLGLLCVVGLIWARGRKTYKGVWVTLFLLGVCLGVLASILSGSRGGWLSLPPVLIYSLIRVRESISRQAIVIAALAFVVLALGAYLVPQTGVKSRVSGVMDNIVGYYNNGKVNTSFGTRLELWRGSIYMIGEKPIFGWGRVDYQTKLKELRSEHVIDPAFIDHPHNDILNAGAKRGLIGVLSLLLLYAIPFFLFRRLEFERNNDAVALGLLGTTVVLCYVVFGLTQTFFAHNSGVMMLVLFLVPAFAVGFPKWRTSEAQDRSAEGIS